MARRNGEIVDLWDEAMLYLKGLPYGAAFSKFLLRDFLEGCRGNEFSESEFSALVKKIENRLKARVPEGSLAEAMISAQPAELLEREKNKLTRQKEGYMRLSKLDELDLNK